VLVRVGDAQVLIGIGRRRIVPLTPLRPDRIAAAAARRLSPTDLRDLMKRQP